MKSLVDDSLDEFQSLIGFKINWNKFSIESVADKKMFQSLIGFKINWNLSIMMFLRLYFCVSIPNRV